VSGKGGLVWIKPRSAIGAHTLFDTSRGVTNWLESSSTALQNSNADSLTAFNNNGFSVGTRATQNGSGVSIVAWTFAKKPKFFDIVTYTGTGANRTIAHSLGSVPGCIMVKRTDVSSDWAVYHSSLANTQYMVLNSTAAAATGATWWNSTTPTSSVFSVGTDTTVNASGGTYVAYIFANNAGGFGASGSENVITCGSFVTDGSSAATVTLGYEPEWVLKVAVAGGSWQVTDSMRGQTASGDDQYLVPSSTAAEASYNRLAPTATGFNIFTGGGAGFTYIYVAIRRGPMKTPTVGTSVFATNLSSATGTVTYTTNFVTDTQLNLDRTAGATNYIGARLIGTNYSDTKTTAVQSSRADWTWASNTTYSTNNFSAGDYVSYGFSRAPGFFDVVCYTGTGATATLTHNLGVVPEFIITKCRDTNGTWWVVYCSVLGANNFLSFTNNGTNGTQSGTLYPTTPTSSSYYVSGSTDVGGSGQTYISYLYATLAGISKVGSYTGTAALLTVNCGFATGARFVLIKRTDSTGDWYIYDSTRGMTSGNDPYLVMNGTAAFPENTTTNYVDTDTTGFKVTAAAPAGLNASGGTYIFLAIA
jgi:hypothetical protein